MLTFNLLLNGAGIPLATTKVLRHQDNRMKLGWSTYRLWRRDPAEFARYESIQGREKFIVGGHVASFVVDPVGEEVFVGLSAVVSAQPNAVEERFNFTDEICPPGTVTIYTLERDARFASLEGRLVIDWGKGKRKWVQRADKRDKPILEFRRDIRDVEWPGYMGVHLSQRDISSLAPNWEAKLAVNGVYLLVCPVTGEQYVGAAFGGGGFLSRWRQYAANGHGGNRLLISRLQRTQEAFQISILEVFGSTTTEADAFAAEARWKRSLGSRAHGLNAN
ncbi:MAG: GIY-YIG nuclease family protein [Hyphomonadaceae bacterium]|nr:GIY-YIG nuclease family protein [Hyphomonadaceae bacterium]